MGKALVSGKSSRLPARGRETNLSNTIESIGRVVVPQDTSNQGRVALAKLCLKGPCDPRGIENWESEGGANYE